MNLVAIDKRTIETAINMLDEIVQCCRKGYKYPLCLKRTKEVAEYLITLLEEGD